MSAEDRTGKETVLGFNLIGETSAKLWSHIIATDDNSTWQGPDGETDRGDRHSQQRRTDPKP